MTDQNAFMETLNSVKEIIRVAETPMSEAEMLAYFADMKLDESQKQLVVAYLSDPANYVEKESEDEQKKEEKETEYEFDDTDSDDMDSEDSDNSKILGMYLEELALLPKYSEEEKKLFYKKLLQGDTEMINTISTAWLERVLEVANKYMEPKLNVEDLIQEGNLALFMKLQNLCGSMAKVDIEEELYRCVEEGIMVYVAELRDEREQENTLVGKVSLVHEDKKLLEEENGHAPTIEELAEYTRMTLEELEEIEEILQTNKN